MKPLDVSPEEAFAADQVDAIVVALYENERPLQGLASRIDWRFRGALSRAIGIGKLKGAPGEVTLVPIRRHDRVVPLILAGAGAAPESGKRPGIPEETARKLRQNLPALGNFRWALSQDDLGPAATQIVKQFNSRTGGELWLTR